MAKLFYYPRPYLAVLVLTSLLDVNTAICTHYNNTSCDQCVADFNCYWCEQMKHCGDKTSGRHFLGKIRQDCGGGEWFSYKQCRINGKYMSHIIYASSVVGVLIVVVFMGVVCFRAYKRRGYDMDDVNPSYGIRTPLVT